MDQQNLTVLRIAIAQLNPVAGDVAGNIELARKARREAMRQNADIVVLSEMFLSGQLQQDFLPSECLQAVEALAKDTADGGPGIAIGFARQEGLELHNCVAVLDAGRIVGLRDKVDVSDHGEPTWTDAFTAGEMAGPVGFRNVRLGFAIGNDIRGDLGIGETLAESGAEILICPSGSSFRQSALDIRHQMALRQIIETGLPVIFTNRTGGEGELVFDGASFVLNADWTLAVQMPQFETAVTVTEWSKGKNGLICTPGKIARISEGPEADYRACVLGVSDHVAKGGFGSVVIGLDGSPGGRLRARIAADAIGPERVRAVSLVDADISDVLVIEAARYARRIGCNHDVIRMDVATNAFEAMLPCNSLDDVTSGRIRQGLRRLMLEAISGQVGAALCGGTGFDPLRHFDHEKIEAMIRLHSTV